MIGYLLASTTSKLRLITDTMPVETGNGEMGAGCCPACGRVVANAGVGSHVY
jgi:hypothetical protein